MSGTLTARLLAEIERREGAWREALLPDPLPRLVPIEDVIADDHATEALAYLAALREIVELHTPKPVQGDESRIYCPTEDYDICAWPCPTIAAVAEGLEVEG